jgi:hypothetical protein
MMSTIVLKPNGIGSYNANSRQPSREIGYEQGGSYSFRWNVKAGKIFKR